MELATWLTLLTAIGGCYAWWRTQRSVAPNLKLVSIFETLPSPRLKVALENVGGTSISIQPRMQLKGLVFSLFPYSQWCALHCIGPQVVGAEESDFLLAPFKRKIFLADLELSESKHYAYLRYINIRFEITSGKTANFHYADTGSMRKISWPRYYLISTILRIASLALLLVLGPLSLILLAVDIRSAQRKEDERIFKHRLLDKLYEQTTMILFRDRR